MNRCYKDTIMSNFFKQATDRGDDSRGGEGDDDSQGGGGGREGSGSGGEGKGKGRGSGDEDSQDAGGSPKKNRGGSASGGEGVSGGDGDADSEVQRVSGRLTNKYKYAGSALEAPNKRGGGDVGKRLSREAANLQKTCLKM